MPLTDSSTGGDPRSSLKRSSRDASITTLNYYQQNAEQYYQETVTLDLSHLYGPCLSLLPEGGKILDAGCGSGRDSLYFKHQGFQVTAFDACAAFVELSTKLIEQPVLHLSYQELSFEDEF